jgi:hypothetical protein
MSELLWTIARDYLLPALASILGALITLGSGYLTAYIRRLHINAATKGILERLSDVVASVVLEMEQTAVAEVKAAMADDSDGGKSITKEEAERIKETAVSKVRSYLGPKGVALLMEVLGLKDRKAADELIGGMIEAEVRVLKGGLDK